MPTRGLIKKLEPEIGLGRPIERINIKFPDFLLKILELIPCNDGDDEPGE